MPLDPEVVITRSDTMPTYDYECAKCGHRFEKFQKMSDDALRSCPKCKGAVQRLIGGGSGIIFKGSGFYQTDYKNKGQGGSKKPKCPKADTCGGGKDCQQ